jgi:hypothetical protein
VQLGGAEGERRLRRKIESEDGVAVPFAVLPIPTRRLCPRRASRGRDSYSDADSNGAGG